MRKFEGMTYKPIELRPLGGRAERKEDNVGGAGAGKLDRQGIPSLKAFLSQVGRLRAELEDSQRLVNSLR